MKAAVVWFAIMIWMVTGSAAQAAQAGPTPIILAVTLNSVVVSDGALLLEGANGALYVSADDLSSWRITPPAHGGITYSGHTYYALADIPGAVSAIDRARLMLALKVPADDFEPSVVAARAAPAVVMTAGRGAYVRYELSDGNLGTAGLGGVAKLGLFSAPSRLESTFVKRPGVAGILRLDTTLIRDEPTLPRTIAYGDVSTSFDPFDAAIRVAGISTSTNFGLEPYEVTFPTQSLSGSAAIPSAVDVYVNGLAAAHADVPAGPFAIQQLPTVSGAGTLTMVVRDELGNLHTVSQSFYGAPELLRPGLSMSSIAAGFERLGYGAQSAAYGRFAGTVSFARGVSPKQTVLARLDAGAGWQSTDLGLRWLTGRAGVITLGGGLSASPLGGGAQGIVGYSIAGPNANLAIEERFTSRAFQQSGEDLYGAPGSAPPGYLSMRDSRVSAGTNIARLGSLGFIYERRSDRISGNLTILAASLAVRAGAGTATLTFDRAGTNSLGPPQIGLGYAVALDGRTSLNVQAPIAGSSGSALQVERALPGAGPGEGYRLTAQMLPGGKNVDLAASVRSPAALSSIDAGWLNGVRYAAATVDGIAGTVDGAPFVAADSGDSFAMVEVPGYPGIRVSVNGQDAGRTDARGRIFLNTMLPYQNNVVKLAADDFPVDADVGSAVQTVSPFAGGGAIVRFGVEPLRAASLRVIDARGLALAPGAIFERDGSTERWPVGDDGLLYLTHVPSTPTSYRTTIDGAACSIVVSLPAKASGVTTLPAQTCR